MNIGLQDCWYCKQGWKPAETCNQAYVFKPTHSWCIYCGYHPQGQVIQSLTRSLASTTRKRSNFEVSWRFIFFFYLFSEIEKKKKRKKKKEKRILAIYGIYEFLSIVEFSFCSVAYIFLCGTYRDMYNEWTIELKAMADRIISMRHQLFDALRTRGQHFLSFIPVLIL